MLLISLEIAHLGSASILGERPRLDARLTISLKLSSRTRLQYRWKAVVV